MRDWNISVKQVYREDSFPPPIRRAEGKKLLAKCHVISGEDVRSLENEGLKGVTEPEEGKLDRTAQ
jgi:hypothetical protein